MQKTQLWYPVIIIILIIVLGFPVAQYYIFDNSQPWDGLSCEEMLDFTMTPEHQDLTMEQHTAFHKDYNPCLNMQP